MGPISDFINSINNLYCTGMSTEHSYRSAFEALFSRLDNDINVINEPKRVEYGAPDIAVQRGDIVIGYLEAKDIGVDLRKLTGSNKEQQQRYLKGCANLIYSNGLDWDFFRDGELVASVSIGQPLETIHPYPEQHDELLHLLQDFISQQPQTITRPKDLAQRMAGKALLIKSVLHNALLDDEDGDSELMAQYEAFREHLIHDISVAEFADVYAETIAYGMFAARLHDQTLSDFSRQEALELLPRSNPFLRSLFGYVAGHDLDDRIAWIINDLAKLFQATNVAEIMQGFGKLTGQQDPFLHFYETFLAAYNPRKRKARGVWYTPEPVVNFIVRAVDQVLQSEFGLTDGLADTSKISIDWDVGQTDRKGNRQMISKEVHRVQILDPATGTGTFLAEVIKQIAPRVKGVAPGMWSQYIEQDLIPRLHGFEILMASYAMCHMKLDMILTDLGYQPSGTQPPRLSVYLTNSLEQGEVTEQTLFAQWLSREAKGANNIKNDMPIMCVIGNPPYSGVSQNMGEWISNMIEDYKYVDGKHFGERKHWLHDDYVKFIRLSEKLIEKNGEGVLGFITNHGYLDNPTFRGMRWHLLNSFHKIWILDLHGNSKKKEVAPDGSLDQNVFDIQQGVSIIIAMRKKNENQKLAIVKHGSIWGSRNIKYSKLDSVSLIDVSNEIINYSHPEYAFVPRNNELHEIYNEGISLQSLMPINSTGIVTMGDNFALAESAEILRSNLDDFLHHDYDEETFKIKYRLGKNYSKWILGNKNMLSSKNLKPVDILYRPFDKRFTYFDNNILWRWRNKVMKNMMRGKNMGLLVSRSAVGEKTWKEVQVSDIIVEFGIMSTRPGNGTPIFPLYIYPDKSELDQSRRINFDSTIYARLQGSSTHPGHGTPNEVNIFDYIYGVLHCPAYRETYAEFLKIDFPRIPWPVTPDEFWIISEQGRLLRELHLMQSDAVGETPYPFHGEGDGVVDKPRYADGKVWINAEQYFDQVPEVSWGFYIGGYQPAQKWLKDRKGRKLTFDDVKHYQKIIKILAETDRIMSGIQMSLPE